jgi:hypothetical protein
METANSSHYDRLKWERIRHDEYCAIGASGVIYQTVTLHHPWNTLLRVYPCNLPLERSVSSYDSLRLARETAGLMDYNQELKQREK